MKKGQLIAFDNARFCPKGKDDVRHDRFKIGVVTHIFPNNSLRVECDVLDLSGNKLRTNTYEITLDEVTDKNPQAQDYQFCV